MSLAGRPSIRVDHKYGWRLVENPEFPREHGDIEVACHDGSMFLTIRCRCGDDMHLHESSIVGLRPEDEVATRCKGTCGQPMLLGGKYLIAAFAEVRERMKSTEGR